MRLCSKTDKFPGTGKLGDDDDKTTRIPTRGDEAVAFVCQSLDDAHSTGVLQTSDRPEP